MHLFNLPTIIQQNLLPDNGTGREVPAEEVCPVSEPSPRSQIGSSPAAFKNGEPFTGGAGETLHLLVEEIMPKAEKELPRAPDWRGIAGYSLAGLFALYAIYQTDVFTRVGCISGSLWFPGFLEYVFTHEPKRRPGCLYFSLGDKEAKTRNPALQTVQENTKAVQAFYRKKGIVTMFQMNRGNHFIQGAERVADGMKWLLKQ